jgi:glutamine synthetase adenylyltransferase
VASANLVPQETVDVLVAAYRAYRARTHHLSLDSRPPKVPVEQFEVERRDVSRIWSEVMA